MEDVIAISAGELSTMAIQSDGSLWAWGENGWGQLGNGTLTEQHTPVMIMENVVAVSAGGSIHVRRDITAAHTMAVQADGSLWAWGNNRWGQLGNGTTTVQHEGILDPIRVLDNVMLPGGHTLQPIFTKTELRFAIGQTQYTHNGVLHINDVAPFIDLAHERTMLPIRAVAETLGAKVSFEDTTHTVIIVRSDGVVFTIPVGVPLPGGMGTPVMINNRTFVPVRYVAEFLGATVEWDGDAQAVYITK